MLLTGSCFVPVLRRRRYEIGISLSASRLRPGVLPYEEADKKLDVADERIRRRRQLDPIPAAALDPLSGELHSIHFLKILSPISIV